jgi:hypothetical protein
MDKHTTAWAEATYLLILELILIATYPRNGGLFNGISTFSSWALRLISAMSVPEHAGFIKDSLCWFTTAIVL